MNFQELHKIRAGYGATDSCEDAQPGDLISTQKQDMFKYVVMYAGDGKND